MKFLLPTLGLGLLALGIFPQWFGLGSEQSASEDSAYGLQEAPELEDAGAFLNLDTLAEEEGSDPEPGSEDLSEREVVEGEPTQAQQQVVLQASGRVVDLSGKPIPGAEVGVLVRQSWDFGRGRRGGWRGRRRSFRPNLLGKSVKTDAMGRFHLTGQTFAQGSATLAIRHPDFAPKLASKDWTQKNSKLDFGDIPLDQGGGARGQVVSDQGAPIAGAEVHYEPQSRRWDQNGILKQLILPAKSDANGFFELAHLPEGNFQLEAKTDKHIPARSKRLRIKGQEKIDAGKITLEVGASLTGTVLDRKGRPIADAVVDFSYGAGQDMRSFWSRNRGRGSREQIRQMMERFRNRMRIRKRAKTDKKGFFEATGLPKTGLRVRVLHKDYITEEKQNIEALKTPRLDFVLYRKLVLQGRLVDAETGRPLTNFAVRARRLGDVNWKPQDPGRGWGNRSSRRGNRRDSRRVSPRNRSNTSGNIRTPRQSRRRPTPKKGKKNPKKKQPDPKEQARKAAKQAAQRTRQEIRRANRTAAVTRRMSKQAREAQRLKERFGSLGMVPGSLPDPSPHSKGLYTLEGLQPGTYAVFATAPGYAKAAAGPVVLHKGSPPATLNLALKPGHTIAGKVLDKITGDPISGARLELFLPPLEETGPSPDPIAQVLRPPSPGTRLDSTTTNSVGAYRFHAQLPGVFRIRVSAPDHARTIVDSVRLPPTKDLEGFNIELSPGASVFGKVLNLEEGSRGNVIFASLEGFRTVVSVDSETGSFEARGLPPGRYFVRLVAMGGRRGRGGIFRTIAEAVSEGSRANPDLVLRDGAKVRFNLDAAATTLARIQGNILWNGRPGKGLNISLTRKKTPGPNPGTSGMAKRILQRITSSLRARADAQGNFKIEDIPPGTYELIVSRNRARDSAPLARQELSLFQGQSFPLNLNIVTGTLALNLLDQQTNKPVGGGRILLALVGESVGKSPKAWRKLPSFRQDRIRGGKVRIKNLPAGSYRYLIQGGGIKAKQGEIFVAAGPLTSPTTLRVTRVKKKKKPKKAPKKNKPKSNQPGSQKGKKK
ncbi:MAG TPA: hypothetical protein ENK02_11050 [Planctomycetes bacterium]|nr:hypothetical protein [Planctomycetota bacterium]